MPDGAVWLRLVTPDTCRMGQSGGRSWPPLSVARLGLINPISKSRIVKFYLIKQNDSTKPDYSLEGLSPICL